MSSTENMVIIVGNSRSGTTMLMRMFSQHPEIATINESHFLERHWSPETNQQTLSATATASLLLRLTSVQRDGYFAPDNPAYEAECNALASELCAGRCTAMDAYKGFLTNELKRNGKQRLCEKTPQYVFFIPELLKHFPNVRIINMGRDPQ